MFIVKEKTVSKAAERLKTQKERILWWSRKEKNVIWKEIWEKRKRHLKKQYKNKNMWKIEHEVIHIRKEGIRKSMRWRCWYQENPANKEKNQKAKMKIPWELCITVRI